MQSWLKPRGRLSSLQLARDQCPPPPPPPPPCQGAPPPWPCPPPLKGAPPPWQKPVPAKPGCPGWPTPWPWWRWGGKPEEEGHGGHEKGGWLCSSARICSSCFLSSALARAVRSSAFSAATTAACAWASAWLACAWKSTRQPWPPLSASPPFRCLARLARRRRSGRRGGGRNCSVAERHRVSVVRLLGHQRGVERLEQEVSGTPWNHMAHLSG